MNSTRGVETWRDVALGAALFLAIAGTLDFMDSESGLAAGEQALRSVAFAVILLVGATAGAGIVWLGLRLIRGAEAIPDVKDALLWNACLIGGIVTVLRMLR
jgi:hypothetical protein